MAESFAPGQRRILNANKGVANVIEQDVINTDLKRVANTKRNLPRMALV